MLQDGVTDSAEWFDPSTATLLPDGRILIVGGFRSDDWVLSSREYLHWLPDEVSLRGEHDDLEVGQEQQIALAGYWLRARVANARRNQGELVRIPVWVREAWACECPFTFLYDPSPDFYPHPIELVAVGPDIAIPEPGECGSTIVVEGSFTGREVERYGQLLPEFNVLRMRESMRSARDLIARVLISGEEHRNAPELFADAAAYLVIVDSVNRQSRDARERADALVQELVDAGFQSAEVFDSRQAPRLFCCYWTVVAGRFEMEEEAQTALAALEASGREGTIRLGW